jgi:hypothetical protein
VEGNKFVRTALARPALIVLALALLLVASVAGDRGRRSLAQEGAATPATPATAATPGTPGAALPDFDQLVAQRPAEIHAGSCAEPGETLAALTPLEKPEGEAQGQPTAIEAERSYTSVPIPIESLLEGQTSVSVLLSEEERESAIACGEIGGVLGEAGSIVVKLSERNGSGFTGIAFLSAEDVGSTGVSVFVAGERTIAETRELVAAATPAAPLEPVPEPTPTAEPVQIVDVFLLEWLIDMPTETRAGRIEFVVTNDGTEPHSLVIESGGTIVAELPRPLGPGETTVLSVTLPEGLYVLYCPLGEGEHREEGMEAALVVVP